MSITRKPLLKHCEELLIQELSNISIQRAGNTISIYDVIKNILEDSKVESVFCEGSFVMYIFNKICKNHSEHRLIKPGDIDLHIDYQGSWYEFIGSKDHRDIQNKITNLSQRRKDILLERRLMDFESSQRHRNDEFKEIVNQIRRLTSENIEDVQTSVSKWRNRKKRFTGFHT